MTRRSHIDRVMQSLSSGSAAARSRLAASWLRSAKNYGLDPAMREMRDSLDSSSLRGRRESMDLVLLVASPTLDDRFGLIGLQCVADGRGFRSVHGMGRIAPRPDVDLFGRDGQETGFDRGKRRR